jgi:hypothetical protein
MIITLRLTQGEYHYLKGLAMKRGNRPLGEIVRFLALAGMPTMPPPDAGEIAPEGS